MSDSVDYSLLAAIERSTSIKPPDCSAQAPDEDDFDAHPSSIAGGCGLANTTLGQSIPLWTSTESIGGYFEVYRTEEVFLTSILRSGGEWRWRLCSSDGAVHASSSAYGNEKACLAAIDALRSCARAAEVRQPPMA